MRPLLLLAVAASLAGCATVVPVGSGTPIDPETVPSCARACGAVGMKVGAIVFIRNMGGCVCEPATPAAPAATPGAPATGARAEGRGGGAALLGGAALVVIEEEQQRQQSASTSSSAPMGSGVSHR